MHELERSANKHFNILTDYDKRQAQLEAHAVRLILGGKGTPDPNQPMIPSPQSAHFRKHCVMCFKSFWAVGVAHFCDECEAINKEENRLEAELDRLERLVRLRDLRQKVKKIKSEQKELDSLAQEMSGFAE